MLRKLKLRVGSVFGVLLILCSGTAMAFDQGDFEKNLTVHTLDNGLTFMLYERHQAPVVSFYTYVDVGANEEVDGISGLAHMFEHMAFKGTSRIGTRDIDAERMAMAKVDKAYEALAAERSRMGGPDPQKLAELDKAFTTSQDEAREHIVNNEFSEIVDQAGGVGLNASTNNDKTDYFFSFPANKIELWAYLESGRYLDPVLREFYQERDVVKEERRFRTESQPVGRLIEQFNAVAFVAHPYRRSVVGHMSDLNSFTRHDAKAFHEKYYVPSNLTISIVGDFETKKLIPILKKYFSRLNAGESTPPLRTVEPVSKAEKTVTLVDPSQPFYLEGYHRVEGTHPDSAAYDALSDVLSSGRTSRLYRRLVQNEKIATFAGAFNGFPGSKYPHLMLFFAVPTPDHSNEEVQDSIRDEIRKVIEVPVTQEELKKVKTGAKAGLIRSLSSNMGIAQQLSFYQSRYGDWREIFRSVEKIEAITAEDIQRVARETFVSSNRTVGVIETRVVEETN